MAYFSVKLDLSEVAKWDRKKLDAFISGYPYSTYDPIWWKEVMVFPEYFCQAKWSSRGLGSEQEVIRVITKFFENAGAQFPTLAAEAVVEFEGDPNNKVDKGGKVKIHLRKGNVSQSYSFNDSKDRESDRKPLK